MSNNPNLTDTEVISAILEINIRMEAKLLALGGIVARLYAKDTGRDLQEVLAELNNNIEANVKKVFENQLGEYIKTEGEEKNKEPEQ